MNAIDPAAQALVAAAPLPTRKLLKRRRNLFFQLIRLAAINLKMLRVISASHHG